jgi:monoamine oxidase
MGLSRRDFLTRIGSAGGYSAAFLSMQALGLAPVPEAAAANAPRAVDALQAAAPNAGRGRSVVILGGGIAGLVAAYELRKLGYTATVLEARSRPGGRNWTVRGQDTVSLMGFPEQSCAWDAGHYQNCGPARLPSVHTTMLGYCKELHVPLEVEINTTRSEFLVNPKANGGKPVVLRQAVNDTRGRVSELLMKSIHSGALDADLSAEDRDRMMSFLGTYGELDKAGKYNGSDRSGYSTLPGAADQTGVLSQPLDMHTLLDEGFWQGMLFEETFDQQATMFQPVGGMDRIPYAFAKSLGEIVQYGAPITEIRKTAHGVRIGYTQAGSPKSIEAEFCICALPLTQLRKIPNDLAAPYKKIAAESTYAEAYKVAWESRRFWEQDYNIYGGLEWVMEGPSPVWMPSWGFFSERGVAVSGYTDERGTPFGTMSLPEKLVASRGSMERLHPGHGKELEKPIYVGWGHVGWNEGSWIRSYSTNGPQRPGRVAAPGGPAQPGGTRAAAAAAAPPIFAELNSAGDPAYEQLLVPDGPVYFAGDHTSHIVGWQEGAALSSLRAVKLITERVQASVAVERSAGVRA